MRLAPATKTAVKIICNSLFIYSCQLIINLKHNRVKTQAFKLMWVVTEHDVNGQTSICVEVCFSIVVQLSVYRHAYMTF